MRLAAAISAQRRSRRALASASQPHLPIWKSSSTCASAQAASARDVPAGMGKRQQHRARQRRHHVQGGQRERVEPIERPGNRCPARLGLGHRHDAGRNLEARAQRVPRPRQDRIPAFGLSPHQLLGAVGAVAHEVAAGVLGDVGAHLGLATRNAVDGGVGEPGQRHRSWVDALALRRPLRRDSLCQASGRQRQPPLGRRAHRLAVEEHAEGALSSLHRHRLVEPLRLRCALAPLAGPSGASPLAVIAHPPPGPPAAPRSSPPAPRCSAPPRARRRAAGAPARDSPRRRPWRRPWR